MIVDIPAPPSAHSGVRHEIKFVLAAEYVDVLRERLFHLCAPDPHFEHNTINSLYFDTPELLSLNEKIQSEFLKRKMRLRWYSDADGREISSDAFLEIKCKEGHRSRKYRRPVAVTADRLRRDPIAVGESLDLTTLVPESEYAAVRRMLPFSVIRYTRHRFIEMASGFRISLDHGIGVTHASHRFCVPGGPGRLRTAVLEVKGPGASGLPPLLRELQAFDLVKTSFSKYAECVNHLLLRKG